MAILIINKDDYSNRLNKFSLVCKKCNSKNVELEIDWAAWPSASWCRVITICKDCNTDEEIFDSG